MKRMVLVVTVGIVMATMLALAAPSFATHPNRDYSELAEQLAELKEKTAKYQDVARAVADGYVAPSRCVQSPAGGMGHHYVNQADVNLDPDDPKAFKVGVGGNHMKPEAMLYEDQNGKLTLVGVEWIVRDMDQLVGTHNTPEPQLRLGNNVVAFHGPMEGHEKWPGSPYTKVVDEIEEPWMPYHYDLHAWIWKDNPSGLFADWNPTVKCPITP
jgi:hypothetical protein